MRSSLILNPTENIPFEQDLSVTAGLLHGLYNSDKIRSRAEQRATDTQFADATPSRLTAERSTPCGPTH